MSKEKHGFFGSFIKILMVIIFAAIGIALIVINSICLSKGATHIEEGYRWVPIVNLVLGCLLLTSPFFLSNKRTGLWKIIKILMIIIFVLIGILLIVVGSWALATNYNVDHKVYQILSIVFGCLLFTSPFFLKKSLMGKEEK